MGIPHDSCTSYAFTSSRGSVVAATVTPVSFRAAALVSRASSCKAPAGKPRREHLDRYLQGGSDAATGGCAVQTRRPVRARGALAALVATGCGGDDEAASDQTAVSSTTVEWAFPGAATPGAVNDYVDTYFTEERLRDAPKGDELPIRPGSPDDSADPDEGTDGPSVSVPPTIPSGQRGPRAALVDPPSGRPARKQKRPWPYVRKRWSGRQNVLPMSTTGTFFIRSPYREDRGKTIQWCSGTVVSSAQKSLVWTAAHCLYDPKEKTWFNKDVVFVPAYKKGARPFGTWGSADAGRQPGVDDLEERKDDLEERRGELGPRRRRCRARAEAGTVHPGRRRIAGDLVRPGEEVTGT